MPQLKINTALLTSEQTQRLDRILQDTDTWRYVLKIEAFLLQERRADGRITPHEVQEITGMADATNMYDALVESGFIAAEKLIEFEQKYASYFKRLEFDRVRDRERRQKNALAIVPPKPLPQPAEQLYLTPEVIAPSRKNDPSSAVQIVWNHYRKRFPTTRRTNLYKSSPEYKVIAARLNEGMTIEELCLGIDAAFHDDHLQGNNSEGKRFLSLPTILKSVSVVQNRIQNYLNPTVKLSSVDKNLLRFASEP